MWAAALGPACAARAALVTRPLTPSGGLRSAICRIAESSKAILKFDDVAAIKFLTHPISSGFTNRPGLEKGKGKKRAAGVPAASVATCPRPWTLGLRRAARPRPGAQIAAS